MVLEKLRCQVANEASFIPDTIGLRVWGFRVSGNGFRVATIYIYIYINTHVYIYIYMYICIWVVVKIRVPFGVP